MKKACIVLATLMAAAPLSAQSGGDQGSLTAVRGVYETVRGYVTAAAEQMPEADYSFKPTPDVRSFGQLIGHIANAGYAFCSAAAGTDRPSAADAEKMTGKAEIVAALKASFAYCDKAYQMAPAKGGESVNFFGAPHTRLSVLAFNMGHDYEHYGNVVTYFRLKGMVPPSSQGGM